MTEMQGLAAEGGHSLYCLPGEIPAVNFNGSR
jgi:hypothetical protein